ADLPSYQREGNVEIRRFSKEIGNFLERAMHFGEWIARIVDEQKDLELAHFRDPWSGAPIALKPHKYAVVYEVNALPSIELPSLFPAIAPRTLAKIREMELACCKAADLIITPSQTTKKLLATEGIDATVIPNGAEIDASQERPHDAPQRYILYFGAAQSWQGIDTLFRAFARLADFEDLHLAICASRESRAWKPYEKLAEKLGVADRIVWRFALGEPELAAWRQHALVSVAPLTDSPRNVRQGCAPLKILESMASGTAVVASDVPPVRELIRDRHDGWLVHPDRPAELARAIRILLDDPSCAHTLGTNARRTIEERFTWDHATTALRRAYKGVMDECLAGAPLSLT
ncbi:MAG TPA: glycosyltransferase family 4 protein, partial [Thermoanaerobaculia bacterium]|nr:glycosyltransferase family 4 protein [Thermoanaerobaculia bacterium]